MPLTYNLSYDGVKISPIQDPESAKSMAGIFGASQTIARGQVLGRVKTAVSAVQVLTIAGSPASGTVTITYGGFSTTAIPYATLIHVTAGTATAAIKAALEALTSIGVGNILSVTRSGSTPNFVYTITFGGDLASVPVALMTATNTFDAGTSVITNSVIGIVAGSLKVSDNDNSDGSEVPVGISIYDVATDTEGNHVIGNVTPSEYGATQKDAPFYYQGAFRKGDLVMLDVTLPSGWRYILGDGTGSDDILLLA